MLAAPQLNTRASFVLPTIKCSVCNQDVAISALADHDDVCVPGGPEPPKGAHLTDTDATCTSSDAYGAITGPTASAPQNIPRSSKQPFLPRIDPKAASMSTLMHRGGAADPNIDKPYIGTGELTPSSSVSDSWDQSPQTPKDGQPLRTPMEMESAYSSNLNPFAQVKGAPTHARKESVTVDLYPPNLSPTTNGARNVMAKLGGIAPGPFGVPDRSSQLSNRGSATRGFAAEYGRRPSAASSIEPLPAVAASFPYHNNAEEEEEEQMPKSGRETHGTIKFGFEDIRPYSTASSRDRNWDRDSEYSHRPKTGESLGSVWSQRTTMPPPQEDAPALPPLKFAHKQLPVEEKQVVIDESDDEGYAPISELPSLGYGNFRQSVKTYTRTAPAPPPVKTSPGGYGFARADSAPSPKLPMLKTDFPVPPRSNTMDDITPLPTLASRPRPHPGVGLPRTPSQTVKSHQERKQALAQKALPPPPPLDSPPMPSMPMEHRTPRSAGKLGEDMAMARANRTRSPSPGRPRSPPSQSRPPMRKGSPSRNNEYTDLPQLDRPFVEKPATYSMSSNASTTLSQFSSQTSSSMSSPPSSEVSVGSRAGGPRFVDPKTFKHDEHRQIDSLMEQLKSGEPTRHRRDASRSHTRTASKQERTTPRPQSPPEPRQPSPLIPQQPTMKLSSPNLRQQQAEVLRQPSPAFREPSPAPPPAPPKDAPSAAPTAPLPAPPTHRRTPTSKGPCRGCDKPIFGKSISSADGRLTGRYHKECFVCQACRVPFPTADFYVMGNLPYCERHYHRLNHTLCKTCDTGIEGPCLETEKKERFHPHCFTCTVRPIR